MTVQNENKLQSFSIRLGLGGLLLMALGLAYLFLTPKSYQAVTRLKVTDWIHARDAKNPSDLGVAPAECQLIRSNTIVDKAIDNLGLKAIWGKRYGQGATLNTEQARGMFLSKASIAPNPKSSLIEIRVTSEIPDETAGIANELARVYLDYRQAQRQELIRDKLGSLKLQWDEANQKLQDALAAQAKIYFEISKVRSINQQQFYDSDAYGLLQGKRIEVEGEYTARQNQLADLKKMSPDRLKQVLASLDENSPLVPTMAQLSKAQSELVSAKTDHGPESSEVKNASIVVGEISNRVDQLVTSTLATKEAELDGLKAMLDDLDKKIKNATTNVPHATAQDQQYAQISGQVKNLKLERDELQSKMDAAESVDAIRPASVTTEIIDTAEIPTKPFSPDRKVGFGFMATGGGVMLLSLVLLALSQRAKPGPRRLIPT